MSVRVIENNFDQQLWNDAAIHPLQSWEWGQAREKMGVEVLRLGEFEHETLKNVFQITFHKIPYLGYKVGYLPRSTFPSQDTLDFLHNFGKKNKVIFIKLEPYERKNSKPQISNSNLAQSSHSLFPDWTIILDLTKTEEELLAQMKSKTRYNVRLAQKKGVIVKEMTNDKGFEIFSRLYFETTKRQKYHGHNLQYHKTIFETLKNKFAFLLIAFYQSTPLSAYELFLFKNILYYPYGGSSEEYRNLMAPNLLMWENIRFGKQHGATQFDMWGALDPSYSHSHPWAGFTRFKEGYGGEFVELVGSFDLIVRPTLYKLYGIGYKLRERILALI